MEAQIIYQAKQNITKQYSDLHSLQTLFLETQEELYDKQIDWPYVFQKVYIHACLHGHRGTAKWLRETFEKKADSISKIAYRQTYAYANILLKKKGQEPL